MTSIKTMRPIVHAALMLSLCGMVLAGDNLCPSNGQKMNIGENRDSIYAQVQTRRNCSILSTLQLVI